MFLFRTSMEDSSHSTPSPMSSAASSQDSLHRNRVAAMQLSQQMDGGGYAGGSLGGHGQAGYYGGHGSLPGQGAGGGHAGQMHQMAMMGGKQSSKNKGVKSTLGRIFGKKDKQLKAMKVRAQTDCSGLR